MAVPLSSFITKFGAVLAITLRDKDIFATTALSCAAIITAHYLEWLNCVSHALYCLKMSVVASISEISTDPTMKKDPTKGSFLKKTKLS